MNVDRAPPAPLAQDVSERAEACLHLAIPAVVDRFSRDFLSLSQPADFRQRLFDELFDLSNDVAIVTGGAGRLGREYAATLARAGARVAVFDLPGASPAALADLEAEGVLTQALDIVHRDQVQAAMHAVVAQLGTPTILVNNAGMGASPVGAALENGPFEEYPEAAWDTMLDSHLKGALFVSQAFLGAYRAEMRPGRGGSIINVSSTYGLVTPDQSLYEYRRREGVPYFKPVGYSVAKSGMLNFTRWLAEYCAPLNVRVNTLAPGGVREEGHAPEFVAEYEKRTPLGRMAQPTDYNGAILFLASRASAYMTGATLVVDGGWTAR
jgi:NAD(P)-dependent dehydrogenase (short-subunit alcohol dehydrogenase family)